MDGGFELKNIHFMAMLSVHAVKIDEVSRPVTQMGSSMVLAENWIKLAAVFIRYKLLLFSV